MDTIGPRNDPENTLGQLLYERREEKGWSLAYVSDNHDVDKGVLSRIERGESTPSLETLYRLRKAYAPISNTTFLTWLDLARQRRGNGGEAA